MSLIRYAEGIIELTKQELKELDCRTKKLLTMNASLHPREDCINQVRFSLERYVKLSEEELEKAVREEDTGSQETATGIKARRRA